MKLSKFISKLQRFIREACDTENVVRTQIRYEKYSFLSLSSTEKGVTDKMYCNFPVIVSLTTYGKKIQEVGLAIESIMHQTWKPNKIVLSVDKSFEGNLPDILERQLKRGLEIIFCKDIRSYTKLVPALRKYPNSIVVTVDDDILYPMDFLEYMIKAYQKDPQKVYFNYGHTISVSPNGTPDPYRKWFMNPAKGSSLFNLPTGVDGVLYPPGCFHQDVCREDIFMELCPYADDLWFKCMTLLKGIECEHIDRIEDVKRDFVHLDAADNISLSKVNNGQNMNDVQFKRLFDKYKLGKYLM